MVLFPFLNKTQQVSFGFVFALGGLVIVAIGLNKLPLVLLDFNISWSIVGFIIFLVGLVYFIDGIN